MYTRYCPRFSQRCTLEYRPFLRKDDRHESTYRHWVCHPCGLQWRQEADAILMHEAAREIQHNAYTLANYGE